MFLKKQIIFFVIALLTLSSHFAYAQMATSTNYRLEDADFTFGGGTSSSATYNALYEVGASADNKGTSSTYNLFPGDVLPWFPSTPPAPTFTNTTGQLYNALDYVINIGDNQTDTNYAIAISTNTFATTLYVQADLTVGTTTVWQTYSVWGGGSGGRITGLDANTTYQIKVKARYGPDSETAFSQIATASTVNQTLSLVISGINSGSTVAGNTTNLTTTATGVPFSTLASGGGAKIAAQNLLVTTNALSGYTVYILQDGDLRKTNGTTISPVPYDNSTPGSWPTNISRGYFGYHTGDSTLCTGTSGRFSSSDTFAAASTSPYEVSCNTGPASSDSTDIVYKAEIGASQPAGSYQNKITYIITAGY